MFLPSLFDSQTLDERKSIAAKSNHAGNAILLKELRSDENKRRLRIVDYLSQNPYKKRVVKDDEFGKVEIQDIDSNGNPIFNSTYNEGAAITARANSLYNGGNLGINIQGQGMAVGVWDGGPVLDNHQEFMINGFSKVSIMDFTSSISNHGTHVAGTIAARGVLSIPITGGTTTVRGIAFDSSIKSYDWNSDLSEMQIEASDGLLMSNHSYGPLLSLSNQLWVLGAYGNDARQLDALCFNNPFYLPVFAAGNDRNSNSIPYTTQLFSKGGYDLIAGKAVAKNPLTVAAVEDVPIYSGSGSVTMSTFSNYGPTDDGRIKPEISMKGVAVRSTTSTSTSSTGFMNGTSMAAPGVTGVVTLLQQYYNQLYGNYMRAATVKGLIMHTADEAGTSPGPDYSFGWGLINADASAKLIRDKNLINNRSIIEELNLNNGGVYTKTINATSSRPLKVSISWTDPAPLPNSTSNPDNINTGTVDPSKKYLINDLDVKVTSSNGVVYYPWKLQGMGNPSAAATNNSTNDVDNFERIDIPNPSGSYTITVTHKGALVGGNQSFTLIANSQNLSTLNTTESFIKDHLNIYPNPVLDVLNIKGNDNIEADVIILDAVGRVVSKQIVNDGKVNVQSLKSGVYMMVYKDKKGREINEKFLKK